MQLCEALQNRYRIEGYLYFYTHHPIPAPEDYFEILVTKTMFDHPDHHDTQKNLQEANSTFNAGFSKISSRQAWASYAPN